MGIDKKTEDVKSVQVTVKEDTAHSLGITVDIIDEEEESLSDSSSDFDNMIDILVCDETNESHDDMTDSDQSNIVEYLTLGGVESIDIDEVNIVVCDADFQWDKNMI